jgi:hypothetical protein
MFNVLDSTGISILRFCRASAMLLGLLLLEASPQCLAQAAYYVDPDYTGNRHTGNASNPWRSLSDTVTNVPWSVINNALVSGPVTVYFSARKAVSDTNQTSTVQLVMQRTDTSTNVLTLDGISQYNTNVSTPSWLVNVTPTPLNWQAASKFQITSTTPFDANASAASCRSNIVLQGFRLIATEGQVINGTYISNFTVRFMEGSRNNGGSYGPGVDIGPGNNGPGCGGKGPANVSILNSYIHNTWGECLYIGASQSDPTPVQSGVPVETGDNYLIQGNKIESCATAGGQGDGIDVKDGHTNLRIIGNIVRPSFGGLGGRDGQGIAIESGSLIDSNYFESPGHDCIAIFAGWNNPGGRSSLDVRNNICVNATSGIGHNSGIEIQSPNSGVTNPWRTVHIYNNTIFKANGTCILIASGNASNVAVVENNVLQTCGDGGLIAPPGEIAAHDHNDFFNITGNAISYNGSFACASVTSTEPHSLCSDPKLISSSIPYADAGFKLESSSPVIDKGITLEGFSNDYFGTTRPQGSAWDIGAAEYVSPSGTPRPF